MYECKYGCTMYECKKGCCKCSLNTVYGTRITVFQIQCTKVTNPLTTLIEANNQLQWLAAFHFPSLNNSTTAQQCTVRLHPFGIQLLKAFGTRLLHAFVLRAFVCWVLMNLLHHPTGMICLQFSLQSKKKKKIIFLRGIKDWGSMAFEATLKKHELSVYYCYPPLLFALMSFLAMPKNSLAVLSPSLKYVNTICRICVSNCFCIVTLYFIWHNLLLALFPKCWN